MDAGSSAVIKYSPLGEKLMTISVGELPETGSAFSGTTDIAFAPNGHLFITDGYGNARVLEYTPNGKRVKQWGKPGSGPGEFGLPHAIQIDEEGTIFVADRENARIQKFNLNGKFLGEISHLGRIYSLKLVGKVLWARLARLGGQVRSQDRQDDRPSRCLPRSAGCILWSRCLLANRSRLWTTRCYGSRRNDAAFYGISVLTNLFQVHACETLLASS